MLPLVQHPQLKPRACTQPAEPRRAARSPPGRGKAARPRGAPRPGRGLHSPAGAGGAPHAGSPRRGAAGDEPEGSRQAARAARKAVSPRPTGGWPSPRPPTPPGRSAPAAAPLRSEPLIWLASASAAASPSRDGDPAAVTARPQVPVPRRPSEPQRGPGRPPTAPRAPPGRTHSMCSARPEPSTVLAPQRCSFSEMSFCRANRSRQRSAGPARPRPAKTGLCPPPRAPRSRRTALGAAPPGQAGPRASPDVPGRAKRRGRLPGAGGKRAAGKAQRGRPGPGRPIPTGRGLQGRAPGAGGPAGTGRGAAGSPVPPPRGAASEQKCCGNPSFGKRLEERCSELFAQGPLLCLSFVPTALVLSSLYLIN